MRKIKKTIIVILIILLLVALGGAIKVYTMGFEFNTYSTSNLLDNQIEKIIEKDGKEYEVDEVASKDINNQYYKIYNVESQDENEYLIANYDKEFNLGKNEVLNLKKVIKSNNKIAVISTDENDKYLILLPIENDKFDSINIVSAESNKLINNIKLTEEAMKSYNGECIGENIFLIQYSSSLEEKIKIELVKKSEE